VRLISKSKYRKLGANRKFIFCISILKKSLILIYYQR